MNYHELFEMLILILDQMNQNQILKHSVGLDSLNMSVNGKNAFYWSDMKVCNPEHLS